MKKHGLRERFFRWCYSGEPGLDQNMAMVSNVLTAAIAVAANVLIWFVLIAGLRPGSWLAGYSLKPVLALGTLVYTGYTLIFVLGALLESGWNTRYILQPNSPSGVPFPPFGFVQRAIDRALIRFVEPIQQEFTEEFGLAGARKAHGPWRRSIIEWAHRPEVEIEVNRFLLKSRAVDLCLRNTPNELDLAASKGRFRRQQRLARMFGIPILGLGDYVECRRMELEGFDPFRLRLADCNNAYNGYRNHGSRYWDERVNIEWGYRITASTLRNYRDRHRSWKSWVAYRAEQAAKATKEVRYT